MNYMNDYMKIIKTDLPGVVILYPRMFNDDRGYFFEKFNSKWFKENVENVDFVQMNQSMSGFNVVRGLHFQKPPFAQAKLVSCVDGYITDIIMDIRKGSPTYGKTIIVHLLSSQNNMVYIPHGFAHGFISNSYGAKLQYMCDNYYNKESEGGVNINSIKDVVIFPQNPIMSDKDHDWPLLDDFDSPFTI